MIGGGVRNPRNKTSSISFGILAFVCLVGAGLFRVWVFQDVIQLGYQLSVAEKKSHKLVGRIEKLRVELAAEHAPSRLETAARRLELMRPNPRNIVGVESVYGGSDDHP